jgi:type IV secretion system protein VirB9
MRWIFLLVVLFSKASFAHYTPKSSPYDARMQKVPYNKEDVTTINVRLGFVTTVIFDDDEIVEKAISGFEAGWSIIPYQNKLFISAVPVEQELPQETEAAGDSVKMKRFEPTARDWRTNLFVSTNKRSYSMDLNIVGQGIYAHVVRYWYPEKDQAEGEKQKIAASLAQGKYPRNWNYYFKAGRDSENIVPDFAYDDGALTYLGFREGKSFPSVFLLNGDEEQIINYSVEQKGRYKVMVIHKLNRGFVLRYGTQVVGILNKSYGQYVKPYSLTSSPNVSREERHE